MSDTTAEGLTEADREALVGVLRPLLGAHADVTANHVIAAGWASPDRLEAVQAERDAARREERMRAEDQTKAWRIIARVEALAEQWNATPDYTASTYDQGRVDQRHDMTMQLLEALGDDPDRELPDKVAP